jgi:arsenate reductase-like glutaredoxin family protein
MNNFVSSKAMGLRFLILLAALALLATGCSKGANTNNANATSGNKNSISSTALSSAPASSPSAAYKAFQEANRKKDYEAVKKSFSKASLEMLTEEAKKENKTLDEFIKQQVDKAQNDEVVGSETITGDSATVEIKDKDGKSSIKLPMVVEDGAWKIAYDRFMKQMQEAFEQMGKESSKSTDNGNSESDNDNK